MNQFVEDCIVLLLAVDISPASKERLKAVLRSNVQTDQYWKDTWGKFAANPDDKEIVSVLETRLMMFFKELIGMTEYQMM